MVEVTKEMWFTFGYIIIGIIVFYLIFVMFMAKKDKFKIARKEKAKQKEQARLKEQKEQENIIKAQIIANKKVISEIKDKTVKVIIPDPELKSFNAFLGNKSKWSIPYWKIKLKDKFFPEKSILINMELTNGMYRHFLVLVKPDNTFKYRGKKYLTDGESKYYVIDSKIWCYDFHEDFTLPFKRKIPLTKIKKSLEYSGISEVEYATNPSTLERFTISKIAEGIMKGQQIDELFKRIQLLIIVGMTASVIHLILFMIKSGMLSQIKIPGVI